VRKGAERAQVRAGEREGENGDEDDDKVEDVPPGRKVRLDTEAQELEDGLEGKHDREEYRASIQDTLQHMELAHARVLEGKHDAAPDNEEENEP
jgi:hypothetical protein